MSDQSSPPPADCIEVSLLGPGYGEAILVHIGDGKWIVIDSCEGVEPGSSAPLDYLHEIGVDPAQAVLAVVISHWDDDHIRGLAKLVTAASTAKVISSAAIRNDDFVRLVTLVNGDRTRLGKTGVDEIARVFNELEDSGRGIVNAIQMRTIPLAGAQGLSHGQAVEVRTLSPADVELNNFLRWVGDQIPGVGAAKKRFPRRHRNDLSVVLQITIGADALLLGGDLEEENKPDTGWSAVLASNAGGQWRRASAFKVAHHGSHTGFHPEVWSEMLGPEAHAILAPWMNGGTTVPSEDERARVVALTPHAFTTATGRLKRQPERGRTATRTIAESVQNFRSAAPVAGHVRLRRSAGDPPGSWSVELFGGAVRLDAWPAPTRTASTSQHSRRRRRSA